VDLGVLECIWVCCSETGSHAERGETFVTWRETWIQMWDDVCWSKLECMSHELLASHRTITCRGTWDVRDMPHMRGCVCWNTLECMWVCCSGTRRIARKSEEMWVLLEICESHSKVRGYVNVICKCYMWMLYVNVEPKKKLLWGYLWGQAIHTKK